MTPTLHIKLLGSFRIVYDDEPLTGVHTARLQALLGYLLLHREAPQSRQQLAFCLWPDSTDAQARTNLRTLLHRLRQALPDADRFLHVDTHTVQWRPGAPFTLDVSRFEEAAARADQAEKLGVQSVARTAWEEAVAHYGGRLLPNCYDDWALAIGERLHHGFISALERLIALLETQRDYVTAIGYAQRLLRHDPLHEATYRRLMRLHALIGNRAGALHAYHTCAAALERELAVEPGPATRVAYERLLMLESPRVPGVPRLGLQPPLVGRDREWTRLRTRWQAAAGGRPHLVLVTGEAGIGKTRLAEELLGWTGRQGITSAATRCYAAEGEVAYAPVTAWLRAYPPPPLDDIWLAEIARLLPELLVERPNLPRPGPLTEAWQRERLLEALARAALASQPLILLIDDLQWCDRETLEWLHFLLRFEPRAQLLVLGTLRPEEPGGQLTLESLLPALARTGQVAEIHLEPLSRAETLSLAAHLAGRELDPALATALFQGSEGNPFFVVEMVRAARVDGREWSAEHGRAMIHPAAAMPPKVRMIVEARLGQLSPTARELAGLAATIGRRFTFDVLKLASTHDEDTLVHALDELWQRRIVREQGGAAYDFGHGKIREVLYSGLSAARRRLLHRRVAQALEFLQAGAPPAAASGQLATHFERAGWLERALAYYVQAAEHAASLYAHSDAERLFARAIELAERLDRHGSELIGLYTARGRVLEHTGQHHKAVEVYQALEALAHERSDRAMECAAILQLVTCYVGPTAVHDVDLATPRIEHGLALARQIGDPELESRLLWSKMVCATHLGHSEVASAAGEASIAIARQHGLRKHLAYALHDRAIHLHLCGHIEKGTAYAAEARALFRELDNLPLLADNLNQQALVDYFHLEFEAALQHAAEAAEISQEIDNCWNLAYAAMVRGLVRAALGEWGQAQADWGECVEFGRDAGFLDALTLVPSEIAALLRTIGQLDHARALHEEAHVASERLARSLLRSVESQLAMDEFVAGQVEAGSEWLRRARTHEPLGEFGTALTLVQPASATVWWARWSGEWEQALEIAERAELKARRRHLLVHQPSLAYELGCCLEGLGRTAEAEARFREAITVAQAASMRPVLWRAHAALAQLYQTQDRATEARAEHQAAARFMLDIADSLDDLAQRETFLNTPSVRAVLYPQPSIPEWQAQSTAVHHPPPRTTPRGLASASKGRIR